MAFHGFIYLNDRLRERFTQIHDALDMLIEAGTTPPEDTAYLGPTNQPLPEQEHIRAVFKICHSLRRAVYFNRGTIRAISSEKLLATPSVNGDVRSAFMNACIGLHPHYREAELSDHIHAVFAYFPRNANSMTLTTVPVSAMQKMIAGDIKKRIALGLEIADDDLYAAQSQAQDYAETLETRVYSAALDIPPEHHGAWALRQPEYEGAETCMVRVLELNPRRDNVAVRSASEVGPHDFKPRSDPQTLSHRRCLPPLYNSGRP